MSNTWDFDDKKKQNFTKFPVGVTRIRLIDDMPNVRWVHWMNNVTNDGKGRSANCPGRGCPICEISRKQKANKEKQTYTMGRRIAMNVFNRETGRLEIMEQGVNFFEDVKILLADLNTSGINFHDVDFKVRRTGMGKDDTKYRVDLGNDNEADPLTKAELKLTEDVVNLSEYFAPTSVEQINRLLRGEKWEDVMKNDEVEENVEVQ